MTEPPIVKLTKRSGTDNVGKLYELKIAALLALRCVENSRIKHAWVASNVEHAGAFDDVVLYVKDENDASTLYMIQLKHQDNPKNIPRRDFLYDVEKKKKNVNEDFSLFKCHRTYLKIKATFGEENEDGMIKVLRKVDKVFYLVYTNRPLGAEYEFINICGDDGTPLDVISGESKIYKFHNCDDFKFEDDFLSNFRLFTQQAHITQVDDLIKMELKRIENRVKIKPSDVDNLFKNYMDFMRVYVQDVKNTFETVTTTDIIKFLTSFYLNRYQVREFLLKYSINPQLSAWKEIVEGKNLVVVNSTAKHFVESYVSASIAGHVKFDNWNQCVPKTILKPIFSYLKPILIGDGNLTVSKVYEALWLQGKVPFLAQVDKFKDLKRIQSVQRLAQNCPYQVIVLTKFDLDIFESPKCLFNLNHLDKERQNMILARPITLQKRLGVCLNNLIDKSMYAFVKCNEMIDVIMDRYNVGEAQGEKLKYYIQRSVSKVLYTSSDLEKIKSKILLRGIDRTTLENIYKKEISNISFESDLHEDDKDYHEFSFDGLKFFELQRSYKSTRGFRNNQLIQPHTLHKLANFSDFDNKWAPLDESFRQDLCVINAYPGMGKTEFFNHAALNAPVNLWVIKITLNKHNDYYDTVKKFDRSFSDHFDYFCGKNINHELTRLIFYKFVKQKNVLVLLDGFDEINTMYVEEVTLIAKSFSENGFKVWVSTRPVTKDHLEEALNTVSRTLKPLSISDQHTFLNNYYKDFGKDEKNVGTIKKFIENLLKSATDNLSETDNQFTGLPLQTKLLADVFEDDLKRILKTNDFAFDDKFDLVYLYETFLEKKNKLFNAKYRDNFVNVQQCFEEFQKLGALLDVFEENLANRFRVKEKFDERLKFYARTNLIGRDGVMWVSVTKQISFVHKTFAEFLAAKWLYENWKVENVSDFVKCRFRKGYEFVFGVFDRYVAKRLPMHLSIVSKNSELIKSNHECVGLKDECGRTVWHLFTCYLNDKESSMILDHLPENIEIEAVDELLGYNPLEYALCNKSYSTANKLCQMSEKLSLKSIDLIPTIDNILDFWTLFDRLFLRALPHFARLAILLNYKNPTKLVNENYAYQLVNYSWQPFSDVKYISTKTAHLSVASFIRNDILHNYYINKYSWELLVDFVKHKYSDDVFVAAAHGDIKDFAKTLKINETDIYNYTALQYANIHNNLPNAIYIVAKSKKIGKVKEIINFQSRDGNTAVHLALREKSFDVARFLIKKGTDLTLTNSYNMTPFLYLCKNGEINDVKNARPKIENINLQNGDGKSALHLAIVNRRNDVARFLIDEGADVNLTDYDGMTAFTSACVTATIDVVKKMRPNIADINFQCKLRRSTALHYAIINKNEDIARFLIDEGADINLPDCDGKSAFLCACETVKNVDIVKKMRLNIADINLQRNVDKKTALHFAVINKDKDLFQFLIDEGTDVNLADDDGQTAFIWACKSADIDIVRKIRPFVTNINLQCKLYKRSALHLAVVNKNEEIVLIDEGADINVTDNGGMTAFLWACRLADIDTVRRMRPNVADINIQCNLYKKSALHLALENNNRDIVKFLIDEGADVGLIDCDGMTAFHCACKSADIDVVKKMRPKVADINLQRNFDKKCALHLAFTNENKDIAQFLIDEGADVNLADEHGQTAFIWACKSADIDIVRKMRPFVANINLQCKLYKKSALHLALMNKNKEIARFLIDEGADINLTDNGGMTAFLWACKLADIDTVRKMRPNVADINIQCNFYKKSALHLALENNNKDIGQFLIDEGADIDLLDWHGMTAFHSTNKSAYIDFVK